MIPIIPERHCGDCKACCEGWLSGKIYNIDMYPGKPCHFVCETGCSIYKDRPEDPCKNYGCLWLEDTNVPGWMKPNKCGVILTHKKIKNIDYIEATETYKKMESEILSWLVMQFVNHNINVCYSIDRTRHWIGSKEFIKAMNDKINKIK
jgi:hypothetical protein